MRPQGIKKAERLARERTARAVVKQLLGWHVVATYGSSSGSAVHTVESDGKEYRCTCQGFRIYKRGYCKHTRLAKEEGK